MIAKEVSAKNQWMELMYSKYERVKVDGGRPLRDAAEIQFIYLHQLLFRPLLLGYTAFNSSYSYWF